MDLKESADMMFMFMFSNYDARGSLFYCAALAEMIFETIYKFLGPITASFRENSAEIKFFILSIIL